MISETCPSRPESSSVHPRHIFVPYQIGRLLTLQAASSLTFTQGLIVGQLSVILLFVVFVKFLIFGDTPSSDVTATIRAAERRSRTLAHKRSLLSVREAQKDPNSPEVPLQPSLNKKKSAILRGLPAAQASIGAILSKTYYRVDSHQPESLDWFNVLIAQTIAQFRSDAQHDDAILTSLTRALNSPSRPDFVDEIKVTELSLGEDFPIFSNCRIIPVDEDGLELNPRERQRDQSTYQHSAHPHTPRGHQPRNSNDDATAYLASAGPGARLQAMMDVDLSDMITLGLETKLLLNFPQARTAVLPVALAVSVIRFSGTLRISFIPSNPSASSSTTMTFSFLDDYRLDLSIRSLVGSRSRLQDVPKMARLIESRLHRWFDERAVEPRFQEIALPSLWPRKKNTRGPDSSAGEIAGGATTGDAALGVSGSLSRAEAEDQEVAKKLQEEARKGVGAEMGARRGGNEGNCLRLRRRHIEASDEFSMPGSLLST